MINVTADQLKILAPNAADLQAYAAAFNETCAKFEINTVRRVRYFVTQCLWETDYLTAWVENLNYSKPERLVAVWPTRFSMASNKPGLAYAPDYVKNPQKLGNLVYANRMGNGGPETGDGFAYRGRGGMHLTGRDNYRRFGADVYLDAAKFLNAPDLVAQPPYSLMSAGWFWKTNALNGYADRDEFTLSTKVVNGSTATAPDRLGLLNKVNKVITA